ncbi:hypothetical protein ACFE04_007703 [Oxalis oulophora]
MQHLIEPDLTPFTGDRRMRSNLNNNRPADLKCPRCESANTKFCYYNNYNLSQPRYFCKCCRRYWTNGGLLRNVPVGGGNRKPKRSAPKSKVKEVEKGGEGSSSTSSENSSTLTAARENNGGGACYERMDSTRRDDETTTSFGYNGNLDERWPRQQQIKMDSNCMISDNFDFQGLITAGLFDQTVQDGGGYGPLDWQGYNCNNNYNNGEQSVFDFTSSNNYWSSDQDYYYSSTLHQQP